MLDQPLGCDPRHHVVGMVDVLAAMGTKGIRERVLEFILADDNAAG